MIVNWEFYVRRKRLDIRSWLERKNIKNYGDLVETTKKLGIETPTEENVSKYFKKPEVKKNDKKIKKPILKRVVKHAPERNIKVADASVDVHENAEASFSPGAAVKKPIEQEENTKQTRKRKPRKKYKSAKTED
jgi:hypothetical protein